MKEWYQKESLVRTHFDRGILLTDFKIAEKLKATAEAGNITATQEFRKIQEANKIEQLKQELFDNEY